MNNGIPQITPTELRQRMDRGDDIFVLDVREPFEYQIANIGGTLIPINEVPQRMNEIDREREVVVHCKFGGRSQRVAEFLAREGYAKVSNLAGGIIAWSNDVDPAVPKY